MISLVVAMAENRAIGLNNDLPWRLPNDLKWFKAKTLGKPIIMGRNTMESLNRRALPGRHNIFISRNFTESVDGFTHVKSLDKALELCSNEEEVCIIGGAYLYAEALPLVNTMYITKVHAQVEADTFFPELNWDEWELIEETRNEADEKHAYAYSFQTWKRKV